ncbi:hypothetical protein D9M68_790480 [compost metagenome]
MSVSFDRPPSHFRGYSVFRTNVSSFRSNAIRIRNLHKTEIGQTNFSIKNQEIGRLDISVGDTLTMQST